MCVCVYVCVCVFKFVYIYIYIYKLKHMHMHKQINGNGMWILFSKEIHQIVLFAIIYTGLPTRGVMIIIIGNWHDDPSSSQLVFNIALGKGMNPTIHFLAMAK